ncbi:nuclease-related domain-containing DEAD/DEAH box helicase [Anaerolinea sp.]|uniref:nuclease-related domain-containing DEAD/DEAH box helicase n=1 Tax=Anaerolinea sp. TaxID=1872519 RepID=UPI0026393D47|nr:UvrD-helicase domain-containing protein [uncultured Anaerolinea sp.]
MAEVVGNLREHATEGEKRTLRFLRQNLPKEFTIYVEPQVFSTRDIRYPDFIVVSNYGYVVLEVKDWIQVEKADPHHVSIRTREGKTREEKNPVTIAREYGFELEKEISKKQSSVVGFSQGWKIPWSYAAVLPNLPQSVITQLWRVWGEGFVWGENDLRIPDLLLNRMKNIFPAFRLQKGGLSREQLNLIRATIFPIVEISRPEGTIILDPAQESIITEPVQLEKPQLTKAQEKEARLQSLFEEVQLEGDQQEEELPPEGANLVKNISIRLLRGFAGSGKTLVLIQRARYLSKLYPDWKIAVVTHNKLLQQWLESELDGTGVKVKTFHGLCYSLLPWALQVEDDQKESLLDKWLDKAREDYPIVEMIGKNAIKQELNWIREMGIVQAEDYIQIERHGVGTKLRLSKGHREGVFNLLQAYRQYLRQNMLWDWNELPYYALEHLQSSEKKEIQQFNAILIDEAQDWAPVWFRVIQHFLLPDQGILFLADDPSQSIYRLFSWKEKGINVVGRTRWLRTPYRNTWEIYNAAYQLIKDNPEIEKSLQETGEFIPPELTPEKMRHGAKPVLKQCENLNDELSFIRNTIFSLTEQDVRENQIAVLVRAKKDIETVKTALKGTDVIVNPIHGFKGLEKQAIIIPFLQKLFTSPNEVEDLRLLYMAMTRARSHLYMSYSGPLPRVMDKLKNAGWVDFIGF